MGFGLILGGIGKGIADAGSAYAGGMMKGVEFEMQNQRDEDRERRLEDRKTKELESLKQRVIAESAQVEQRATEMGTQRESADVTRAATELSGRMSGLSSQAQSPKELEQYMRDNPEYKKGLERAGLIGSDKMNPELQAASDRSKAALQLGSHSSVIDAYDKQRSAVLAQIKEDRAEKAAQSTANYQVAMGEAASRRADAADKSASAAEKNAAAREMKANQPAGEKPITGVDLERTAKAAERALSLQLGVPLKDVPETVARLKKTNKMDADTQGFVDEYTSSLKEWQGYKRKSKPDGASSDNATPQLEKTKPNAPAQPTINELPKGAVAIGMSGGKQVYQTPDGKKYIAR